MATKKKAATAKRVAKKTLKKHAPRKASKTAGTTSPAQQHGEKMESAAIKKFSDRRQMNTGEVVVNLFGQLTTRKLPLIFGSGYDCAPLAEFFAEFQKVNKLAAVREDFPVGNEVKGLDHLTNMPKANQSTDCRPLTTQETFSKVIAAIRQHDKNQQNEIIANLLMELETERINRVNVIKNDMDSLEKQQFQAMTTLHGFQEIRKGGFDALAFVKLPMPEILSMAPGAKSE